MATHRAKSDRRSVAFDRAAADRRAGWDFATTYSRHPTPDDFDTLSDTFGVEPRPAFERRVASRRLP